MSESNLFGELEIDIIKSDTPDSLKRLLVTSLADLCFDVYHARPEEIAQFLAKERKKEINCAVRTGFERYHESSGWSEPSASTNKRLELESEIIYRTECDDFELISEDQLFVADAPDMFCWKRKTSQAQELYINGMLRKHIIHYEGSILTCKIILEDQVSDESRGNIVGTKYGNVLHRLSTVLGKYHRKPTVSVKLNAVKIELPPLLILDVDKSYDGDPAHI